MRQLQFYFNILSEADSTYNNGFLAENNEGFQTRELDTKDNDNGNNRDDVGSVLNAFKVKCI